MNNVNKLPLLVIASLALTVGCRKSNDNAKDLRDFVQVNLVANNWKYSPKLVDPTLQNAWGLAFSGGGTPWVNSNGGGVSEVYTAEGALISARPAVNIPTPTDSMGGNPTGIVFAGGKGFKLSNKAAAAFLFVTEDGVLSGWNGGAGNNAIRIKTLNSKFKGMAISSWGGANFIYAADFKWSKIVVWDTNFAQVSMPFHDPGIPSSYSPFNIQAVGGWLFVTYAKVGPTGDDVKGAGNGFVSIFKPDGSFVSRFASHGHLNSPWGVAAAGGTFLDKNDMGDDDEMDDHKSNAKSVTSSNHEGNDDKHLSDSVVLVGNFGDGKINAYSLTGKFLGQLKSHKQTIVIDGLWALSFPPTTSTIDQGRLYFTAGPNGEKDGLFGYLIKQ